MSEDDGRYWISDPIGHRKHVMGLWAEEGETVEFMGEQVPVIHVAPYADDEYVCDMCNASMPTIHSFMYDDDDQVCLACGRSECPQNGEPIPVKCVGSYGLCKDCAKPHEVESEWPNVTCGCPPCVAQAKRWEESWRKSLTS